MFGKTSKIIALVLSLVMILSICGVSATWYYARSGGITPVSSTAEVDVIDWTWNTSSLIEAIIAEMNDSSSDIETNLQERFDGSGNNWSWLGFGKYYYYGSMDPQHDSTGIAALLEDYENMSFIVQAVIGDNETTSNYTTAYVYTCDMYLGVAGSSTVGPLSASNKTLGSPTVPLGENIYKVYRTEIHRDDASSDWEEVETLLGYAPMYWYDENRSFSSQTSMIPSYDIANWAQGTRGYSMSTAVFIYGDSENETTFKAYNDLYDVNADLEKKDYTDNGYSDYYFVLEVGGSEYDSGIDSGALFWATDIYYTYEYTPEGSYTISCLPSGATITILDSSGNEIDGGIITDGANGTYSVTFSAGTAGTKYYIKLSSEGTTSSVTVTYNG